MDRDRRGVERRTGTTPRLKVGPTTEHGKITTVECRNSEGPTTKRSRKRDSDSKEKKEGLNFVKTHYVERV